MTAAVAKQIRDHLDDWQWRMNNLYTITNVEGDRIPFRMNWAQESLFDDMHYLNLILKARQLGMTTFVQLFMLDAALFNPDIRCGTIAHTREDAEAIFKDKVKFPYDNLLEGIKEKLPANDDSARKLSFANNSSIRVGTSLRSGTLQYLHVSEHGKICAKFPEKAREIKTGALNTVHSGQIIFIESTAEGWEGDFHNMCQDAQSKLNRGADLSPLDFKFHFYPWWKHPAYRLDPAYVEFNSGHEKYFDELADMGISLDPEQRAWYVKKLDQQGDDMGREFPSTPEEAFAASIEGAYWGPQLTQAEKDGRITNVPHDAAANVETWWDLGHHDYMSIWFLQRCGQELHLIDFVQHAGEALPYYANIITEKAREGQWTLGKCVLPHDAEVHSLTDGKTRTQVLKDLGFDVTVMRKQGVLDGIDTVRREFPRMWFDAAKCAEGIRCLRAYRKDWNDRLGCWASEPRHDENSHAADALRTGMQYTPTVHSRERIVYPKLPIV